MSAGGKDKTNFLNFLKISSVNIAVSVGKAILFGLYYETLMETLFCRKPCAKTCGLCAGCDLIKALGLSTDNLQNFGVNVKDCGTFCSNGTEGCTQQCEENQQDCELCTRCD